MYLEFFLLPEGLTTNACEHLSSVPYSSRSCEGHQTQNHSTSLLGVYPLPVRTIDTQRKFNDIANNDTTAHNVTGGMRLIAKKVSQMINAEGWINIPKFTVAAA